MQKAKKGKGKKKKRKKEAGHFLRADSVVVCHSKSKGRKSHEWRVHSVAMSIDNNLAISLFIKNSLQGNHFYMTTDIGIEKFNHVIIRLKKMREAWLFQVTYSATNISYQQLFPDPRLKGNNFDLYKHIQSYVTAERIMAQYHLTNKYVIFTNATFEEYSGDNHEWIGHGFINCKTFGFDFGGNCISLIPKPNKLTAIRDWINREFYALSEVIVDLMKGRDVKVKLLYEYRSYLSNILCVVDNFVKLCEPLDEEEEYDYSAIYQNIQIHFQADIQHVRIAKTKLPPDVRGALEYILELNPNKNKNKNKGKSKNVPPPPLVTCAMVKNFFDHFVLAVNQPKNLRTIDNDNIWIWMKGHIRPDDLGKFTEYELLLPRINFVKVFEKCDMRQHAISHREGMHCIQDIRRQLLAKSTLVPAVFDRSYYTKRTFSSFNSWISDTKLPNLLLNNCINGKIIVVIGESGMGKTTTLQYIGFETQQKHLEVNVMLIYLKDLNTKLQNVTITDNTYSDISRVIPYTFDHVLSDINLNILQYGTNPASSTLLLLDGFDEITIPNRAKALALINGLLLISHVRIIVTGNVNVQNMLEDKFKIKAVLFQPFSRYEKMEILDKYWNFPTDNYLTKHKFKTFVSILLKRFEFEITGMALVMEQLAYLYFEEFTTYCESSSKNPPIDAISKYNALQLYTALVVYSYSISFPTGENSDENLQQYLFNCQLVAINQFLKTFESFETFESVISDTNNVQRIKLFRTSLSNSSLINVANFKFIHKSVAEYFVATYLFNNIEQHWKSLFPIMQSHRLVRTFFFMLIEDNYSTSQVHVSILYQLYINYPEIIFWTCADNCVNIVKHLIETRSDNYIRQIHNIKDDNYIQQTYDIELLSDVALNAYGVELFTYLLGINSINTQGVRNKCLQLATPLLGNVYRAVAYLDQDLIVEPPSSLARSEDSGHDSDETMSNNHDYLSDGEFESDQDDNGNSDFANLKNLDIQLKLGIIKVALEKLSSL